MHLNTSFAWFSRGRVSSSVLVRILAALFLCFGSGLADRNSGIALQASPPDTSDPQQPAGSEAAFDETPELTETKLAAIETALEHADRPALRGYLRDLDAAVQAAAFEALAALDSVSALQDLFALVKDTTYPNRAQAVQLLTQSPLVDERTQMAVLRTALSDSDPLVADYAAQALAGPTQDDTDSPNTDLAQGKLAAASRSGRNVDRNAFGRYLQDTDPAALAAAFEAMAAKDSQSAILEMIKTIKDTGQSNRLQALRVLDQLPFADDATMREVLEAAVDDPDPAVSEYASAALARRAAPDAASSADQPQ